MSKANGSVPSMRWLCVLFGHRPTGQITGFRNMDGAAITRCRGCNAPLVSDFWKFSESPDRDSEFLLDRLDGRRASYFVQWAMGKYLVAEKEKIESKSVADLVREYDETRNARIQGQNNV